MSASEIGYGIWQGSIPPEGSTLAEKGVDVLVLCAEEHQPPSSRFPGVRTVIHCPLDDSVPTPQEMILARKAAREVAQASKRGRRVLVTCIQGRNRSGLVIALALVELTGRSGRRVVQHVQSRRRDALTNHYFVRAIEGLQPASETR